MNSHNVTFLSLCTVDAFFILQNIKKKIADESVIAIDRSIDGNLFGTSFFVKSSPAMYYRSTATCYFYKGQIRWVFINWKELCRVNETDKSFRLLGKTLAYNCWSSMKKLYLVSAWSSWMCGSYQQPDRTSYPFWFERHWCIPSYVYCILWLMGGSKENFIIINCLSSTSQSKT